MSDRYAAVRRPEYSTLGDAYRMCKQDPEVFAGLARSMRSTRSPAVAARCPAAYSRAHTNP